MPTTSSRRGVSIATCSASSRCRGRTFRFPATGSASTARCRSTWARTASSTPIASTSRSATDNTGVVDHIAFLATQPEAFAARFNAVGLPARKRYFPEFRLFQMFVQDPNGLTIELNFHGIESEPQWGAGAENYAEMPRVR